MSKNSKKAAKKTTSKKQTPATKAAESKPIKTPVQEAPAEAKATKKARAAKPPKPPRETKAGLIRQMIQREGGASVEELVKAAAWQSHSVRGFISNLGRKQGLKIESIKREDGVRAYTLCGAPHKV